MGQPRILQFGGVIYDESQVEERIRHAQRAILNPSKSMELFLNESETGNEKGHSESTFSSNCITLQISGPDIADLSFCDLPGIFYE